MALFHLLLAALLPLEVVGCGYEAAPVGHSVSEQRLFRSRFTAGVDDMFPSGSE